MTKNDAAFAAAAADALLLEESPDGGGGVDFQPKGALTELVVPLKAGAFAPPLTPLPPLAVLLLLLLLLLLLTFGGSNALPSGAEVGARLPKRAAGGAFMSCFWCGGGRGAPPKEGTEANERPPPNTGTTVEGTASAYAGGAATADAAGTFPVLGRMPTERVNAAPLLLLLLLKELPKTGAADRGTAAAGLGKPIPPRTGIPRLPSPLACCESTGGAGVSSTPPPPPPPPPTGFGEGGAAALKAVKVNMLGVRRSCFDETPLC